VWLDTIEKGRYDDTNQMFVKPTNFNFKVTSKNAKNWALKIVRDLEKYL